MKTTSTTTYILLDKGTEDIQLLSELKKIIGQHNCKEFYAQCPLVAELMQTLRYEVEKPEFIGE